MDEIPDCKAVRGDPNSQADILNRSTRNQAASPDMICFAPRPFERFPVQILVLLTLNMLNGSNGTPNLKWDRVGGETRSDRFRGGLVFKARRLLYHSILGSRVIKNRKTRFDLFDDVSDSDVARVVRCTTVPLRLGSRVLGSGAEAWGFWGWV